jgi:hypothetical protein
MVAKNGKVEFYTYNSFQILQLKSFSTILLFIYVMIDYKLFQSMQTMLFLEF